MEDENYGEAPTRNSMQKVALTAIYDALTYKNMGLDIDVHDIVSSLCEQPFEDCDYFVKAALVMMIKHYDEAVAAFSAKMRKWTFDRLNRIEQAVLLLAYVHYFYVDPSVEKGVVIDIAVKQAKLFLDDKDYKFVNAILDNVLNHAE